MFVSALGGCIAPMSAGEARDVATTRLTRYCNGHCERHQLAQHRQKIKDRWLVDFDAPTHKSPSSWTATAIPKSRPGISEKRRRRSRASRSGGSARAPNAAALQASGFVSSARCHPVRSDSVRTRHAQRRGKGIVYWNALQGLAPRLDARRVRARLLRNVWAGERSTGPSASPPKPDLSAARQSGSPGNSPPRSFCSRAASSSEPTHSATTVLHVEIACASPTSVRTKTWFSGDWLRSLT